MKTTILFLAISTALLFNAPKAQAQEKMSTEISYNVIFGPVFPIEGRSSQLDGRITLNDTTGVLEKLDFEVPLNSFIGQNAGYLAWVGNSWTFPDMQFRSNNITLKGDTWIVKGNLEFRGRNQPVTLRLNRTDKNGEIVLSGNFSLNPRDYFIIPPSIELVPNQIPMDLTMVFEQPSMASSGEDS